MACRFERKSYTHLIIVAALALLALAGCTVAGDSYYTEGESDEMTDPSRWGQSRAIGPNWVENTPYVLLQLPTLDPPTELTEPLVLNVALGATFQTPLGGAAIFRWRIQSGTGGAARHWLIDARPLQQVSLSASTLEVSLLAQRFNVDSPAYVNPKCTISAAALVAVGNTSTEQATYTSHIGGLVAGEVFRFGAELDSPIPAGASSFRLIGQSAGATSPFQAAVLISWRAAVSNVFQATGLELLPTMLSGGFIPIPGGGDELRITNGTPGNVQNFAIQWGIDL